MTHLTQSRLVELFIYDPESGVFRRRVRKGPWSAGQEAGALSDEGYVMIVIDGRRYRAHRLAWLYVTGAWPEAKVRHRDGRRENNAWANLLRSANPAA